jgi:hypothetical protein
MGAEFVWRAAPNGTVMAGLVPATHAFLAPLLKQDVGARDKPGHDDVDGSERKTAPTGARPQITPGTQRFTRARYAS